MFVTKNVRSIVLGQNLEPIVAEEAKVQNSLQIPYFENAGSP
jgi:hypothetical protein